MKWQDIQLPQIEIPRSDVTTITSNPPNRPSTDFEKYMANRELAFRGALNDSFAAINNANALNNRYMTGMFGLAQQLHDQLRLQQQQQQNPQIVPQSADLYAPQPGDYALVDSPKDAAYNFGFMMKNGKYYSYKTPEAGARALLKQISNYITGNSQAAKEYDMVRGFPVGKYKHRGATWYSVPTGTSYKPFADGQNPNTIGHIWGSGLYAPRGHGNNNPDEYVANLVKWSGIGRDEILDPNNPEQMARLLMAVGRMEGNRWYSQLTPNVIKSLYRR